MEPARRRLLSSGAASERERPPCKEPGLAGRCRGKQGLREFVGLGWFPRPARGRGERSSHEETEIQIASGGGHDAS